MSKLKQKRSHLEVLFLSLWNSLCPQYPPKQEYMFAKPRRWRFDFAWPDKMVAVEIEGGTWVAGAHNRGQHFRSDAEKYRAATILGWRVLRYVTNDLRERPTLITEEIKNLLEI